MSSTPDTPQSAPTEGKKKFRLLDVVEIAGNRLPDPSILFLIGALLVMVASAAASLGGWEVVKKVPMQVTDAAGVVSLELVPAMKSVTTVTDAGETIVSQEPEVLRAVNLLTSDGIYWALRTMVRNFMDFPPLGIVLVGMLGIGVAERTGLIAALLKIFMLITPEKLLTPAMVFLGVMSSLASDAGYVVLPPLAALLYKAVGRSPIVGIAAVFAGVSAGFNANLVVTGLDPMLAGLSQTGAQFVDPEYAVNPACNWLFMIASTIMATLVGWATTAWIVEPRFARKSPDEGGPSPVDEAELAQHRLTAQEKRGLGRATAVLVVGLALVVVNVVVPGFPLNGKGVIFDRWAEAIVPLLFILFLLPGLAFGMTNGTIRSTKDLARLMTESMAAMSPIIVLAFFAAQFVAYFQYSNLGAMLAITGGEYLSTLGLPMFLLLLAFILLTAVFNLFVGSMSAKYALFAPIFIPMLMLVGISPELTQAAYRIGDSVTNIITPLNAYLIIILVFMQKHDRSAGMGTLIATMLPYTFTFTIAWCAMLGLWLLLGIPLGIPFETGPLEYVPRAMP
ncbi:MAG: AbgT family transporter [Phycisphaeraceae bacterium]|nr:AbgT family transporter [Phycisphaeraceae bacterium]MCW5762156.1 AbgT family transporter [Phycisphaeraceae bacterium]